jgi:hypothetical protein
MRLMQLRANKWIIWGLVLALQLGAFLITKLTLHKPALELLLPYLVTFIGPVVALVLVASWLRKWEARGPAPKLLALCWSLNIAILVAAVDGAIFYYGARFHIMKPSVDDVVFVMVACVLSASIPVYFGVIKIIGARASARHP